MKNYTLTLLFLVCISWLHAQEITVNQVGYFTDQVKLAIVPSSYEGNFQLINDSTQEIEYTGDLSASATWAPAAQTVRIADFSAFRKPGRYHLIIEDSEASSPGFTIGNDIYANLGRESLRFYYLSRVSMPLLEEYAGEYARAAGHPDTAVRIHASAASAERPEGSTISTPRGWYDAGDYNKYVTNAGISNYTVFAIAEHYPEYAANLDLNIPESNNNVPDIIDEGVYDLRWMLSMQDPNDGGVYHKCTHLNFTGFVTPSQAATVPRYVVMKTTAAALDMAAVAAQACRILRQYEEDYPGLADSCLAASIYAYEWAQAHPAVYYTQPADVSTGSYGDRNVTDEFKWAAIELYITTLNEEYLNDYDYLSGNVSSPGWGSVYPLGLISLLRNEAGLTGAVDMVTVKNKIVGYADTYFNAYKSSAYRVPATGFYWGSNSGVGNGALMALQAYYITGEEKYREAAIAGMDYLLGRNPTRFSFVTGFGTKTPMSPHDRKSASDAVVAPIPAMLVGGPNPDNTYDCGDNAYPSLLDALCYLDDECSYSTNEITINWNAPLAYVSCALQSLQSPQIIAAYTGVNDSAKLYIEFDAELKESSIALMDFSLTVNDGATRNISSAGLAGANMLELQLDSYFTAIDSNILFTYLPGDLMSVNTSRVDTILDQEVLNLVYGSAPVVLSASTDAVEPVIHIGFSKKMLDPSPYGNDFMVLNQDGAINIAEAAYSGDDSLSIQLRLESSLSYKDTLTVSYQGTTFASIEGGLLKKFSHFPVINTYPLPATLMEYSLNPGGDRLELVFSKSLIDTSVHAEDFSFTRNNGESLTIEDAWLSESNDQAVILAFSEAVVIGDTNLLLNYAGHLLSYQFITVEAFGPLSVDNTVSLPHPIPGSFEAEDFFENVGYTFENCTDEGGGVNLAYADPGDYIDYYVDVAETGLYTLTYRLANGGGASLFRVYMPEDLPIDTVSVAPTGDWQNWTSQYGLVNLEAGDQLLRIETVTSAFNINWLKFESGNTIPPDALALQGEGTQEVLIYPNPVQCGDPVHIDISVEIDSELTIRLYDLSGRQMDALYSGKMTAGRHHITTKNLDHSLTSGLYLILIRNEGSRVTQLLQVE